MVMALGLPVVHLRGKVRRVVDVVVPARPAQMSEDGSRIIRDAAPGYTMVECTVDSGLDGFDEDAGPTTLSWRQSDGEFAGLVHVTGDVIDCLARPFVWWQRFGERSRPQIRFVLVSEKVPTLNGRPLTGASSAA